MSIEQFFNVQALQIWRQHLSEPALMPSQYPLGHFKLDQKLLMVGMNPAFDEVLIQKRLDKLNCHLRTSDVFAWERDLEPAHVQMLLKVEQVAFDNYHRFFKPMRDFAASVGCAGSYSHLDLFHWRHTEQNTLSQFVGLPKALNDFGKAQVALTRDTIATARPKVVVIANATAAKTALKYLPLQYLANSSTQCTMPGVPETRFFLAGMLSGRRSMDTFSRTRLENEVRSYLNEIDLTDAACLRKR